jgi:CubicO group peptidase (beta-lactamase class C family)
MSMKRNLATVADLARPVRLARALARAFDGVGERCAFVGLRCGRELASAFVADGGGFGSDVPYAPLPVGCLAKLLTATLAAQTLAKARIDVETHLVDLVDVDGWHSALERVTLRHLLEHTHGLDDSLIDGPALVDGFIDVRDLARRASAARTLAHPGLVYSYGSIGAWLMAAALERLAARPYAVLLRDELLAPLGIPVGSRWAARDERPCPANGGGLSLTIADWLRFLRFAAAIPSLLDAGERASTPITPLPGWNPLERGIRLGWKYHGSGWFGHQSVWPRSSALVRVNPQRGIELALLSRDHAASVIAGRIFGDALPELFELRMPPPLPRAAAPVDTRLYVGRYASAAVHAELRVSGDALDLCVENRVRGGCQRATLSPAAAHVFFVRPAIESFPYVQLVAAGDRGLTYLWNGRFVLPRL